MVRSRLIGSIGGDPYNFVAIFWAVAFLVFLSASAGTRVIPTNFGFLTHDVIVDVNQTITLLDSWERGTRVNGCNGDITPGDPSERTQASSPSLTCPTSSPKISAQ
jgi:hypothetical protein